MVSPGTQFTCFTGEKAQILTRSSGIAMGFSAHNAQLWATGPLEIVVRVRGALLGEHTLVAYSQAVEVCRALIEP